MSIDNLKLHTKKEAAELLGITSSNFNYTFFKNNKMIPTPTRIGGRVYFTTKSLKDFVDNNTLSVGA